MVSDDSVRLSWERIDLPEIAKYKVHYTLTEQRQNETIEYSIMFPATNDDLLIGCLLMDTSRNQNGPGDTF